MRHAQWGCGAIPSGELQRSPRRSNRASPGTSGAAAAPSPLRATAAALTVELYRRYGRLVGSAAVRQEWTLRDSPRQPPPATFTSKPGFPTPWNGEFEIHVRSSLGDGDLLYQRVIGGAELTRFHIIELR